jgi:hypothetical protein
MFLFVLGLYTFEEDGTMLELNVVFWDVTPCGCCENRRFGGMHLLHFLAEKIQRARNNLHIN